MTGHFAKLEEAYVRAPINAFYSPSISVGEGTAEIEITLRPDLWHAAQAVHGSVYFKMLDDAAFFAANSLVQDYFVLTQSFNLYLTRPVSEGWIRSVGRVTSRSSRIILAESELMDDQGREIARGSGAFMTSRIALGPDIGYVLPSEGA